ncbi:hypothetical protein TIFTF001_021935 [Ficus carica]|uniref:Disease resistance R13L4/SHOC-2-like LRR domain-containing protein n=1 Tax=Ficus carica TaxID=3494 RepID=A0AA88AHP6_FICCA|nr:hypothetical protein TIFTF001_021935 [Ficus carica]
MSVEIPPQLGNLYSLEVLDLGYNYVLKMKTMGWVSHLSSLRLLSLSSTNMSQVTDWMQVVNKLPHLMNLQLHACNLPNVTSSSLSLVNSSTSLAILDLSFNQLSVSIYQWVFSFSRSLVHLDLSSNALVYLSLSSNKFEGPIPEALGNLTKLTYLDLGSNNLDGELPNSLGNLCMLRELSAGGNNLSGLLPFELTQSFPRCTFNSLVFLGLENNRFGGSLPNLTIFPSLKGVILSGNQYNETVPETIGQLPQLESLQLDGNSLEGVITEAHFSKLTKLCSLDLSDNSLTLKINDHWVPPFQLDSILLRSCKLAQFPRWLQTQIKFSWLDISNSEISDSIPDWLWDISPKCWMMDLSNNQIHGKIKSYSLEFQGLPMIDLSSNKLEGSIPSFLFNVGALNLSTNRFSRLSSICNVTNVSPLSFLDISFNQLSGDIPDCWSPFKELKVLSLANNKLSGEIPISIGSITEIETLHLGNNSLTKELTSSMKNCTNLMALGVEENRLEGPIPTWIGESLTELIVLSLRSNHFSGSIPSQFSRKVELVWKGKVSKFDKILGLVKSIDLSSNKLSGEIPTEITELIQLVSLNLSRNKFIRRIPSEIGKLALLDALDLSNNLLSGGIPSSLTEVARLNVLDLSNNSLSGKIPTGTQLQSFEASSYAGNPELCGAPLQKRCPGDEPTVSTAPAARDEEDQDKFVTPGFYVTLGLGFVVGFWGVLGSLIFSKTWRYSYFNFVDDANDWVYVMVAVNKAKLLRMIRKLKERFCKWCGEYEFS